MISFGQWGVLLLRIGADWMLEDQSSRLHPAVKRRRGAGERMEGAKRADERN